MTFDLGLEPIYAPSRTGSDSVPRCWIPPRRCPTCFSPWDKPLQVESVGELMPVASDAPIVRLTPFQTATVALNLVGENQWHIKDLLRAGSCVAAYTVTDKARLRINIFAQRGNYSIVLLQAQHGDSHARRLEDAGNHRPDSPGKNRPGAGDRRDRFRQIQPHAGGGVERVQPHQGDAHHHAGGPG